MAVETMVHPPPRMTLAHGGRALAVGIAAEVTGTAANPDHAIAIAVIAAAGTIVTVLLQATISDWLRNRHAADPPAKHPDYDEEQSALNDLLLAQMVHLQRDNDDIRADNDDLRSENARLRKRRP